MKKFMFTVVMFTFLMAFCCTAKATSLADVMNAHKTEIIRMCRDYGIWPSQLIGQAGIESGIYDITQLASVHNNYWGLTYSSQIASKVPTGVCYEYFCSFPSFMEGVKAYCLWWWQSYYGGVQGVLYSLGSTPDQLYSAIIASGFMEQRNGYIEGMHAAIDALDAREWDALAYPEGRKFVPHVDGMDCTHEAVGEYDYPIDKYNTNYTVEEAIQLQREIAIENALAGAGSSEQARYAKYTIYGEEAKKHDMELTLSIAVKESEKEDRLSGIKIERTANIKKPNVPVKTAKDKKNSVKTKQR